MIVGQFFHFQSLKVLEILEIDFSITLNKYFWTITNISEVTLVFV